MAFFGKWCARLGAVASAAVLAVFVPVAAWAASDPGELVVDAARRRPRIGMGALFLPICCLLVVGGVVLIVVLIMRGRRSGGR